MKRILSIMCVLCLIVCMVPVMALAADSDDQYLTFNGTEWSGNTEQIQENGRFYTVDNSNKQYSITYKTPLTFSGDFAITTYIHALSHNSNRHGEYNALVLGRLELREYNNEYIDDAGNEVGVYTVKLFYNGNELASANMSTPNHYYTLVKQGNLIRVMLDQQYVSLTNANGQTVYGVSASSMSFSAVSLKVLLTANFYNGRYAEGVIIDRNYTDVVPTDDVVYPDESLYIIDPENGKNVITYMNTAASIPTGTDNKVVKYNYDGIYFESDLWQAVPMINQELIDRGYLEGGEACQAIASVVVSSDDRLAMFGTDISGIYRSLDGGDHWQSCTIGLDAGGATGIAIDPTNPDHVIIVGCNTGAAVSNGIFVTTNALGQCEWTKGLSAREISGTYKAIKTHNDYRVQIVYDLNSYNASKGYCTTAYWSVEDVTITNDDVEYPQQAMWKTTDGGFSWVKLEKTVGTIYVNRVAQTSSAFLAGAEMASYNANGKFYMYAANKNGFYISTDGGKNWTETLNRHGIYANSVDVIETEVAGHDTSAVGKIWITTDTAMYRSNDFGYTWNKIDGLYYPAYRFSDGSAYTPDNISVSSLNPDNLYVTERNTNGSGWYSNNGGKSWAKSHQQIGQQVTWQPVSGVSPFGFWSNVHENTLVVEANGLWKSINGGKNIKWSNSGFNAIATTGIWNFNVNHPEYIAISSQDYNGGYSTDGGKTWTYLPWRGEAWGGFTYGAYMLNEKTVFICDAMGWTDPRYLWITFDAGETCINTGIQVNGLKAGTGCLGDDNVAFMGEWRTEDGGHTWKEMISDSSTGSLGCKGVLAIDMKRGTLFGANGNRLVYSTDKGLTWFQLANVGSSIEDIAYDNESGKIYVTAGSTLYAGYIDFNNGNNSLTSVNYVEAGSFAAANTVAVDPNNPNVVYVGGNGDINAASYDEGGIYRSLDCGKTWTCITRQVGDGRDMSADGGKKATCMRVNPTTSELLVSCDCRGMWKIAPPAQWYLDSLTDDGKTATEPVDPNGAILYESKKDLIETGKYANYSGYTPKTVTLELIDKDAGVEYEYFKVPNRVKIYTGDKIKLGCSHAITGKMPNGNSYDRIFINTTAIKGNWDYNVQACTNSDGAHTFSEPGWYTIYTIGNSGATDWALVSFYVAAPYEGYTEINNVSDLQNVQYDLNGNYILTADISVKNWTSIGSSTSSFNGVFYGNGHKISGLTAPLFANNNGAISHLEVEGSVSGKALLADTNSSYVAYCKVSGSVSGNGVGALSTTNNGIIKNCVVDATVTGNGNGAVAGINNGGTISGCYYARNMNVIGSGVLTDTDVNYTYTDITDATQFEMLDDNWYQNKGSAPSVVVERSYTKQDFYDIFDGYVIEDDYLYVDCLGNPVDMFIGEHSFEGATLAAYAPDGTLLDAYKDVNTGDTFTMSWEGKSLSVKVVLVGDLMGNGTVTSAGYDKIALHVSGHTALSGAFEKAADLDGDGAVTSADLLTYRQALLGLKNILE